MNVGTRGWLHTGAFYARDTCTLGLCAEHLLPVLRGELRKQSSRHAASLIFWASHPLSFILWVLLLVVEVHLCLTVCFPLGRPCLDYPNIRAGGWCSWISLWRENDHTRKKHVYTEEILRAENLSNSNSVWPDKQTDQLWKFIVGQ